MHILGTFLRIFPKSTNEMARRLLPCCRKLQVSIASERAQRMTQTTLQLMQERFHT